MNTPSKLLIVAAAGAGLIASSALAQRNYNPKTVEIVQGKVLSVEKTSPPAERGSGVHLSLQTDKETITVHVGPAWFVEKQPLQIAANDTITVTGSRVTIEGKPTLIAAQIKKGQDVLKLRDEFGIPVWAGAHPRSR